MSWSSNIYNKALANKNNILSLASKGLSALKSASTLGTVLPYAAPVALGALGVGALGYGGYKLYQAWKNRNKPKEEILTEQYDPATRKLIVNDKMMQGLRWGKQAGSKYLNRGLEWSKQAGRNLYDRGKLWADTRGRQLLTEGQKWANQKKNQALQKGIAWAEKRVK